MLLFTGIGYTFWPEFFVKKNYEKYVSKPLSSWFKKEPKEASKKCDCGPAAREKPGKFEPFSLKREFQNAKEQAKTNQNNRLIKTRQKFISIKEMMQIKN